METTTNTTNEPENGLDGLQRKAAELHARLLHEEAAKLEAQARDIMSEYEAEAERDAALDRAFGIPRGRSKGTITSGDATDDEILDRGFGTKHKELSEDEKLDLAFGLAKGDYRRDAFELA